MGNTRTDTGVLLRELVANLGAIVIARFVHSIRTRARRFLVDLPPPIGVFASELGSKKRRRTRKIRAGQDLRNLRHLPKTVEQDQVWAISTVKNEADTIEHVIDHLLSQGIARVVIADNMSTDDTPSILRRLGEQLPVTCVSDVVEGYYQAEKMTRLARAAARGGAHWIIPFDADELWYADREPLARFLRRTKADIVEAEVYDYVPTRADDIGEQNPFRRIQFRCASPSGMTKVAFRAYRLAQLSQGNHDVRRPGSRTTGIEIAHFPHRTAQQFVRKLRDGREALVSTDLPDDYGTHWRRGGSLSTAELKRQWERLLDGQDVPFAVSSDLSNLVRDPVLQKTAVV